MIELESEKPSSMQRKPIPRQTYQSMLRAALHVEHYRFAREAALSWLAVYPGDLSGGLAYGQALAGERRYEQSLTVLEGLCAADPEFVPAARSWAAVTRLAGVDGALAENWLYALTGKQPETVEAEAWARETLSARRAISGNNPTGALNPVRKALAADPPSALPWVTHLTYLLASPTIPLDTRRRYAERYAQKWPDCLIFNLVLAEWAMEAGDTGFAVGLLHQSAARDVGGQIPIRLWGEDHPYRSLWPGALELTPSFAVPADVAAHLGWNRLSVGSSDELSAPDVKPEDEVQSGDPNFPEMSGLGWAIGAVEQKDRTSSEIPLERAVLGNVQPGSIQIEIDDSDAGSSQLDSMAASLEEMDAGQAKPADDTAGNGVESDEQDQAASEAELDAGEHEFISDADERRNGRDLQPLPDGIKAIEAGLAKAAKSWKMPGLERLDGRFPVYVIFSVRNRLQEVYGRRTANFLETEMQRLAQSIQASPGWGAMVFCPDDVEVTTSLGMEQVRSVDPWKLKLALADLDQALERRGEMIGALLIVGGPEIVPFHNLPNPVDDPDQDVPSDNPYASRDENYFMSEWPIGRLPGGDGRDARLLAASLQRIRKQRRAQSRHQAKLTGWIERMQAWFGGLRKPANGSFGYTAEIWRGAAETVFKPIGSPKRIHASPPRGLYEGSFVSASQDNRATGGLRGGVPLPNGKLGYFNLHGLVDAPEWYGQRDPLKQDEGPDYPVALRPEDIDLATQGSRNRLPQIVFSEACYGVHIQDKTVEQAISLKFLQAGTQVVVGSTCMAYGGVGEPLAAADLLGFAFWRFLREGMPAGEALRQAKIYLANEMSRRQGFLDGEDQKTLISFVLYGDPLTMLENNRRMAKSVQRLAENRQIPATICDREEDALEQVVVSAETLEAARNVVARYLPGMTDARLAFSIRRSDCQGEGHECPTSQQQTPTRGRGKGRQAIDQGMRLVKLSKQVPRLEGIHTHYAHLTLDERGELVKLVVSR